MFGPVATVTGPAGELWGYHVSISTVYDGTEQSKEGNQSEREKLFFQFISSHFIIPLLPSFPPPSFHPTSLTITLTSILPLSLPGFVFKCAQTDVSDALLA